MNHVGTKNARQAREALTRTLLQRFQPGDKLPAEAALARDLGVSRNTLREALEELRVRGAVTRTWGIGTFMSPRRATIDYTLSDLVSIDALVTLSGHRCTQEHKVLGQVTAPQEVLDELEIETGSRCWHTARRYFADDDPVIIVDEYLRATIGETQTDPEDVGMDLMEYCNELGHPLALAEMRIYPTIADEATARQLNVSPGTPLLRTTSVSITHDGIPAVYAIGIMRSDVLDIKVVRTPPLAP